ncbi:MAG: DUF2058 family protein [Candidatus Competibacter sp.]|nr:DUF2058 family protein [Candidatus Competibacter sp.]MDG4585499.1 DUF2058 family protein [Candidatus Competibacter sp.]
MSLRDELLKAGLIPSEQAKKRDSDTRRQEHQRKKNKALGVAEEARREEARQRVEAEAARKREQDRQLNRKREAERQLRELVARARQLIDAHRLNEPSAEAIYNFRDGRFIRAIRVTSAQRKVLARGRLAIVRGDRDEFDFPLVPRETADKLAQFMPERVLLLYPESDFDETEDEWED